MNLLTLHDVTQYLAVKKKVKETYFSHVSEAKF